MVMGGLSRVGEQHQAHAPPSDDRVHSQISVFGGTQQSEQYGDARRVRHTPHPGGKMKSGMVSRYAGETRKRWTSVMSFGATTEFSYAGGSQAMAASNTAWQNRDNPCALYSMWPQAEKDKRRPQQKFAQEGGGEGGEGAHEQADSSDSLDSPDVNCKSLSVSRLPPTRTWVQMHTHKHMCSDTLIYRDTGTPIHTNK